MSAPTSSILKNAREAYNRIIELNITDPLKTIKTKSLFLVQIFIVFKRQIWIAFPGSFPLL